MRRRFGYLHVPKTAGSSVSSALRSAVETHGGGSVSIQRCSMDRTLFGGFDGFEHVAARDQIYLDDPSHLAGDDVVMGHFALGSLLEGRRPHDIAMLAREPGARLRSLYAFWRSWTEAQHAEWDPYRASRTAVDLDWEGFLSAADIAAQTDNTMARLLLHPHPLIPVDGFIAADDVASLRSDALAAVGSLGHVGAIENAPHCWSALADWLGCPLEVGRRNVTPTVEAAGGSRAPAAGELRALHDRTSIDTAIWRYAASGGGARNDGRGGSSTASPARLSARTGGALRRYWLRLRRH